MKIILLQDYQSLGKKGELKEVKFGFAKNFLLPQKIAALATKALVKEIEAKIQREKQDLERQINYYKEIITNLKKIKAFNISIKALPSGHIFGSVGSQEIQKSLKGKGFEIQDSFIKLEKPFKEIGEYKVLIDFGSGVKTYIKLNIKRERKKRVRKNAVAKQAKKD